MAPFSRQTRKSVSSGNYTSADYYSVAWGSHVDLVPESRIYLTLELLRSHGPVISGHTRCCISERQTLLTIVLTADDCRRERRRKPIGGQDPAGKLLPSGSAKRDDNAGSLQQ
jgi:hypothetical protein